MFIPFVKFSSVVFSAKHVFKIFFSMMCADINRQLRGAAASSGLGPGPRGGRRPRLGQVSGGGGSGGGTSHPPAAGEGKRATQGGSERGRGKERAREGTQLGSDSSLHCCRCLLPPPLAEESPPGPLLSPPMQPGMNAQRRLAYPEVKHPTASSIRIGAGPGSEHMEKK